MLALGIVLLAGALVLLLAEAHVSTGGLLGLLGTAAALCGIVLVLIVAGASAPVVLIVALVIGAAIVTGLLVLRNRIAPARGRRPRTGSEALVGHVGVVRGIGDDDVQVFVDGALWRARPDPVDGAVELRVGDRVVVERIEGLTLDVRRAEQWELVR